MIQLDAFPNVIPSLVPGDHVTIQVIRKRGALLVVYTSKKADSDQSQVVRLHR